MRPCSHSDHITSGIVFEQGGIDYAGSIEIRNGYVHKSVLVKVYVCFFLSHSVMAVNLEIVSDRAGRYSPI